MVIASHCIGQVRIQVASTALRVSRMRGESQTRAVYSVLYFLHYVHYLHRSM